MEITNNFFRNSTPANEYLENLKSLSKDRTERMKVIQEKMKQNNKKSTHLNPVDAFPGDAVIFVRVLNLLRGLSSTMNVRVVYLDIMRPFAEATLLGSRMFNQVGYSTSQKWIYEAPALSGVEGKLRQLLIDLGSNKILGVQVCAYKDGKVIIDTAAGTLGRYNPRPVQPDSLFPVFSATKGITAGLLHWLVDNGKLKLEENVGTIWPSFSCNGKDHIKVCHVLNHTSELQNAMGNVMKENPLVMCNWTESLKCIAETVPETEPGVEQIYHYLSFGWICGGIIEQASGKRFQEVLEEVVVHPLNVEGELYVGVPPGVESRLATLTIDAEDLQGLTQDAAMRGAPPAATMNTADIVSLVSKIPVTFNMLPVRRATIPAANGHCSARALARYYATLAAAGSIPPPHTSSCSPPLGSHPHIPTFPSPEDSKKPKGKKKSRATTRAKSDHSNGNGGCRKEYKAVNTDDHDVDREDDNTTATPRKIFSNPRIHDAFLGVGDSYGDMVLQGGKFGLGFRRFTSGDGLTCFGHSGIGGSTGFCDIKHGFAMAITVNKMSFGGVTRKIVQLVCSELQIPVPEEFSTDGARGPDMAFNFGTTPGAPSLS